MHFKYLQLTPEILAVLTLQTEALELYNSELSRLPLTDESLIEQPASFESFRSYNELPVTRSQFNIIYLISTLECKH